METFKLRNSSKIGNFLKPYIIAEVNTSHNGKMDKAKKMVDAAKDAGCNCVKFQSFTTESLYSKIIYEQNPISKRMVKQFSFTDDQIIEIARYSKEVGIDFSSTPYSKHEVDFLVDICQVPFIKIASMDLNNYPFLEYIAKKMCLLFFLLEWRN